jgi:hypothetical protein
VNVVEATAAVDVVEATAAIEAAQSDLSSAKGAAAKADHKYRETVFAAEAIDASALAWARGERDSARNAVRDAEARLVAARDEHTAALAALRDEEACQVARAAEQARQGERDACAAPHVAKLEAALAVVDDGARETMRVASVVFDPDGVLRAEHPDARARVVAAAHRAAPLVTAIARAELAAEDAADAADALAAIDSTHPALASARLAITATSKSVVFEQVIKLAALVGRTDMPHASPIGRARGAIEELRFSRKTGRWWTGDRAARESHLRALISPAVDMIVPQVIEQMTPRAPRGPFFVGTGGTQRHEIPQTRPQLCTPQGELRNAFGPPAPPREQIIAYLGLDGMEHELVPDVAAPFAADATTA